MQNYPFSYEKQLSFAIKGTLTPNLLVCHLSAFETRKEILLQGLYTRAMRFRSDFIFPKATLATQWPLSSVINNSLSFVGFNATASLYKGKLHSSERPYPPPFMPCKGARKRRRLSKRAPVIAVACIWIKSSGLSWSLRIDDYAQIARTDVHGILYVALSPRFTLCFKIRNCYRALVDSIRINS